MSLLIGCCTMGTVKIKRSSPNIDITVENRFGKMSYSEFAWKWGSRPPWPEVRIFRFSVLTTRSSRKKLIEPLAPRVSSDLLIICFLSLYIAHDTELFDKRIKPWVLPVLFLNKKNKTKKTKELCVDLDFQTVSPTAGFHHDSLHALLPFAHHDFVFSLFSL